MFSFRQFIRRQFDLWQSDTALPSSSDSTARYQPVAATVSPRLSTNVPTFEGINMNLQLIIAAIQALETLMPSVQSFVNTVHPGANQATQKANTAVALTEAALTSAGIASSTFAQLRPAIVASVSAPLASPSAVANTSAQASTATGTDATAQAPVAAETA
jgi:hypothetical protein